MLEIKEVYKSYDKAEVLHGISLEVKPGEIHGLIGENSAGKTTMMKCILGLLRYSGKITLDGEPITHKNIARLSFATCGKL